MPQKNKHEKKQKTEYLAFEIDKYKFTVSFNNWCNFANNDVLFEVTTDDKKLSVLCNIVIEDTDKLEEFLSLNVNYKEPSFAIGKFSSGKRDRQSEREILISRNIDKIIRPLLIGVQNKTISINLMMLNYADNMDLCSISCSAAIFCLKSIYNINCAILKMAISKENDIILFPSINDSTESIGNIVIGANKDQIFFLDIECDNFSNAKICQHVKKCIDYIEIICKNLEKIESKEELPEIKDNIKIIKKLDNKFDGLDLSKKLEIPYEVVRKSVSAYLFKNNTRLDKRELDEIRKISMEKGPIEKCHNVVFSRGDTVVLGIINPCNDKLNIGETIREEQNIISVYNFPGSCVGSVQNKHLSRREMGHGDLIRASFQKILHKNIGLRTYAEVLSSNGSSSMASVCAISCAGVQMGIFQEIIGGISIGIFRKDKNEIYITDINAKEDQYGEVDFKITGTKNGISAIRADVKSYILVKNLSKIIKQGEVAILEIIDKIEKSGFKNENTMINIDIDKKKLGLIIGPNGRNIKELSFKTGCKIKTNQDGNVCILGKNIDLATMLIKPFQNENTLKSKEKIGLILKEDCDSKVIHTHFGEFILNKKMECKKGDILIVKIKKWEEKEVTFVEKIEIAYTPEENTSGNDINRKKPQFKGKKR